MKKLIVSHIRNEEYLLRFWLTYHKKYFDHGVIIDYGSTDKSVDVIKEICPTWDIIPSRYEQMGTDTMDLQVEEEESRFPGWWKTCLSTTEFLVGDFNKLDSITEPTKIAVPQFQMVDKVTETSNNPDTSIDLIRQKKYGIHYNDKINYPSEKFMDNKSDQRLEGWIRSLRNGWKTRRTRILHNFTHKHKYPLGRHYDNFNDADKENFIILYYRFSPWNNSMQSRIIDIQNNMTQNDKNKGLGIEHLLSIEGAMAWHKVWEESSRDLSEEIDFFIKKLPK